MASAAKIYVGNIPYGFQESEFRSMFENFGELVSCVVKEGYAFVEYTSEKIAEAAIEAMHDKDLDGRPLRVEKTRVEAMGRLSAATGGAGREETNNIFVANIPEESTEDELRAVFEEYGKITRIKLLPPHPGVSALSGFVDFEDINNSIKAHDDVIVMKGSTLRTDYNSRRRNRRDDRSDRGGRFQDSPRRDYRHSGRRRDDSPPRSSRRRYDDSPPRSSRRRYDDSPPRSSKRRYDSPPQGSSGRRYDDAEDRGRHRDSRDDRRPDSRRRSTSRDERRRDDSFRNDHREDRPNSRRDGDHRRGTNDRQRSRSRSPRGRDNRDHRRRECSPPRYGDRNGRGRSRSPRR